jgi:CDP-diacylglycerol--glycerol-3-phosphate 3-phosphatidyltransferase
LEAQFLRKVYLSEAQDRIRLLEYERQGWTWHAKGFWFQPPSTLSLPTMTLFGSSNFGRRSFERDLEANVLLVTKDEALREQLSMVILKEFMNRI